MALAESINNYNEILNIKGDVLDYCQKKRNPKLSNFIDILKKENINEINEIHNIVENLKKTINFIIKQNFIALKSIELSEAVYIHIHILTGEIESDKFRDTIYLEKTINKLREFILSLESKRRLTTWPKGNGSLAMWILSVIIGLVFFSTNSITKNYLYTGIFSYLVPAVSKISLFLATTQGIALTILIACVGAGALINKLTRNKNKAITNIQSPYISSSFNNHTAQNKQAIYKQYGYMYNRKDVDSDMTKSNQKFGYTTQ